MLTFLSVSQINADIDAQAALDIALKVFAQIQVLLHGAVGDIEAIVNGDINVVLYLGGKAQDVKVVAEVLAALLEVGNSWLRVCSCLTILLLDCCPCSWPCSKSLHFH